MMEHQNVQSPPVLPQDGGNKREHDAEPGEDTPRPKRLKLDHPNAHEMPVDHAEQYLGPVLYTSRSVELMMQTWNTSRTAETDVSVFKESSSSNWNYS